MSDTSSSDSSNATLGGDVDGGLPILLEDVTKDYPNTHRPAVDHITMEIPAGQIVMLVGPSGCGKTTTMRMINRLIEPTSGKILIGGNDVLSLDDVELRRRIGYVIQQIGLFPHLTIAENVALVPKLLKWDKAKIDTRVDEMLSVVGLDPGHYRDRYPRQLSGGQQQRVGVARALAADPPIMLMDEPFGAVDPITREHLQDEFLALQQRLRKTIVFVTHDFDEAVKMGDRIAVLREGSEIAQYASPEEILTNPADDFVAGFVGRGAVLKRLRLEPVDAMGLGPAQAANGVRVPNTASMHDALDAMLGSGEEVVGVTDADDRVVGSVRLGDIVSRLAAVGAQPTDMETLADERAAR